VGRQIRVAEEHRRAAVVVAAGLADLQAEVASAAIARESVTDADAGVDITRGDRVEVAVVDAHHGRAVMHGLRGDAAGVVDRRGEAGDVTARSGNARTRKRETDPRAV